MKIYCVSIYLIIKKEKEREMELTGEINDQELSNSLSWCFLAADEPQNPKSKTQILSMNQFINDHIFQ